jgi:exopolysaccharide biosynthesis operon protein EpsL
MKLVRFAAFCTLFVASQHLYAQQQADYTAADLTRYTPLEKEKWFEDQRSLKLRATAGITYDSNLLRQSDEPGAPNAGTSQKDDFIYRLGAGAKYDVQSSRQKFTVEANVAEYRFQNFDNLNYTGDDLRGEWLWQAGNDWSGTLGIGQRRYLENFSNFQQDVRDVVNQNRAYGSADYLLNSHLKLSVNGSYYDTQHGDSNRTVLDSRIGNLGFAVNWVTPALNTAGLQYKRSDATYPNNEVVATTSLANDYHDDEYSVITHWVASGASEFIARVGYTKRTFDQLPSRNFSDPTWRLTYLWKVTGKTAIDFSTWREIAEFEDLTANFVRDTGVSVTPAWSITQQLILRGKVSYEIRKYVGDPGIVPITQRREDRDRVVQIAALWTPLRLTEFSLTTEAGRRTSNQAFVDYKYESVSLGLAYYF